ncbi:hypothetical protein [Hymenobacter chitinivorans]|uniref:Uncharacterized protein n=1 Tax=Hymenobacter chitinivorans DSM 11115 TaxID=1121954 RepID=A0A2M9AS86_9BACT|nr:hypothetical protein [Hymenobacter chitinivorans]PJJ48558.1 hypothetical protein CLV45_4267 [Hymenobacter chitinivorans DSM 11115]
MKTVALLLILAVCGAEAAEAMSTSAPSTSTTLTITAGSVEARIFNRDAAKRRKKRKSRPAYRRLGILPVPAPAAYTYVA